MDDALLNPLKDPFEYFHEWMCEALSAGMIEPHAMTLATASTAGRPSARQVLLKGYSESGFIFYTNYQSRKADEIRANSFASAVLWWDKLYRQVRIEGKVEVLSATMSDEYFASRPRGSQISAWASPQSEVIAGFAQLQERVTELEAQFAGKKVPRPHNWGGYRIVPHCLEFWQGRKDRLHERIRYRRQNGVWIPELLGP